MNKKGSIQDILLVGMVVLVFAVVVLFGYKFMSELNTQVQANDDIDARGKLATSTLTSHYPGVIDNVFLVLIVGLAIGALALAALVRVHPIFIAFYILALIFIIFFCGVYSNIYQEMAANSELIAQADNLTFISTILTYLPLIVGTFGTLLAIVIYKSYQNG